MVTGALAYHDLKAADPQALSRVIDLLKQHPCYEDRWLPANEPVTGWPTSSRVQWEARTGRSHPPTSGYHFSEKIQGTRWSPQCVHSSNAVLRAPGKCKTTFCLASGKEMMFGARVVNEL